MMTRKATILLAGAAIACMAVLSGCSKGVFGYGGKAVTFTTTSGGSTTKTYYGDEDKEVTDDNNVKHLIQPLNWKNGDVITIASPQAIVIDGQLAGEHASHYVVKDASEGVPSKARVDNEGTNGLTWLDEKVESGYDFYAIYPKFKENSIELTAEGAVTATIPNGQNLSGNSSQKTIGGITYNVYQPNMDYAFMTAAAHEVQPSDGKNAVSLEFTPAFTAFEFNVSSQDDEAIQLTSFELLSPKPSATEDAPDKIAGTFKMNAGNLGSVNVTAGTNSITADLSSAPAIDGEKGLSFTVFALPVENTQALRLRFTSKDGNDYKTSYVDMKYSDNQDEDGKYYAGDNHGQPVIFEAGHKYRINMLKLPSSQWKIVIVPDFEEWDTDTEEVVIYI